MRSPSQQVCLLALALLGSAIMQPLFGQTQPPQSITDVLLDLFFERHILSAELQPFLEQESQLENQLLNLVQQQSRLQADLRAVQDRQNQLNAQAQVVAGELIDVRTQEQQNTAKIVQDATSLLQLEEQYTQLATMISFNPLCNGCPVECPDECLLALVELAQIQASIEPLRPELEQLIATKSLLEAQRSQLQLEQQSIQDDQQLAETE